ncbi:hypothetical protein MFLO_15124 [Listeria floridensis FSL S10-1187]|uniref:Uncharacterized protein n=1 Tax=Listeria floridensis FSL S10-1187 TaxID=1265817 RepID=A0ABN0RBL0_9LIST|nr:hypothetical protein MFLO_15124 [Listeria floridensis FSL S10-1187]
MTMTTEQTKLMIEADQVDLYYGAKQALKKVSLAIKKKPCDGANRSVWMRQIDFSADAQSDE